MKRIVFLISFLTYQIGIAQLPDLIFNSGFEPQTRTFEEESGSVDIIGIDSSVSPPNDWENDLENHPFIGSFKVQYQGGDSTMRRAVIAPDPLNTINNTMHFWILEPNVDDIKGRVQANLYNSDNGIKKLYYSVRLYLPKDFNTIKNAPFDFDWLTLMEFWNNANWTGEDFLFRAKVDLKKVSESADSLRVRVSGQAYDEQNGNWSNDVWEYTNPDFLVPVQKWMTLKMYFVEGDECTGRFMFTITPDGEAETIVHDVRNFTHHPLDPDPDGLKHFNPMKLYTSDDLIEYITDSGSLLNVFWDDFEIWKDSVRVIEDTCFQGGITFNSQEQIDDFASNYPFCKRVYGDVTIESGATEISNLLGLSQLISIKGRLIINSNNDLISLEGLENLDFTCFSGLEIMNNPLLSICDQINICEYLENGGVATISNNAADCNSVDEVLAQCINSSEDIIEDSRFKIFPNPTEGTLNITNYDFQEVQLKMMDFTGKLIFQRHFSGDEIIDLHQYPSGVYFLNLKTQEGMFIKKIVKN